MDKKRALIAGIVGGLVHFVVIGGLYTYLRGPILWGYHAYSNSFAAFEPIHIYIFTGTFLLGVLPAILLVEYRLVSPLSWPEFFFYRRPV